MFAEPFVQHVNFLLLAAVSAKRCKLINISLYIVKDCIDVSLVLLLYLIYNSMLIVYDVLNTLIFSTYMVQLTLNIQYI